MLNIIWGSTKDKPQSAQSLVDTLAPNHDGEGYLYIGYPVIGTPTGPLKLDALLVSRTHGLVGFDLVEGVDVDDYQSRLDEIASMLEVKLKPYPSLKKGRNLLFEVNAITFAPAKTTVPNAQPPYVCANRTNLLES